MARKDHIRRVFRFRDPGLFSRALGPDRSNLKQLEALKIRFEAHGCTVRLIDGPQEALRAASDLLTQWKENAEVETPIDPNGRSTMGKAKLRIVGGDQQRSSSTSVQPKNAHQREYLTCLREKELVFGLGPAGTGKTFLAVVAAVQALEAGDVSKLVITRPAVEAGEKLGFLPGSFAEKVDPYLQPIWDSLNYLLGKPAVELMKKNGKIEVAPLAYMRGRTLSESFILLDEAQNCTWKQILMLLTRMGEGSRCVVTGDSSQTDLRGEQSGLNKMVDILEGVEGLEVFRFSSDDVVRHPLVGRIIQAVEAFEAGEDY